MESFTDKMTLDDLRSLEHTAGDGNDRYFLGLCTLFVATIEDAKDRISQLELVFCDQIFPALQNKIRESCQVAQASEDRHHKDFQEWKSNKEALMRELDDLRGERDSLLQTEASLRTEIHDLHRQLEENKEANEKIQRGECKPLEMQENLDLSRECWQSSWDLGILKSKMPSSFSLNSSSKVSEDNLDVEKARELSNEYLNRQLSSAIEREKKRTQAVLTKLNALKKSYKNLRKQYTVLFRRTHPSGNHHKDGSFLTIHEKKESSEAKYDRQLQNDSCENRNKNWRCINASKTEDKSVYIGNGKEGYEGLNQSEGIGNEDNSDRILVQQVSDPVQDSGIKVNDMVENEGHRELQSDGNVGHCTSSGNLDLSPVINRRENRYTENQKVHEDDDSSGAPVVSVLRNLQETANLDKASQVGYDNGSQLDVPEHISNSDRHKLEEVVDSCDPRVSCQDSQMTKPFAPFRLMQFETKKKKAHDEAGWFPIQKRALSGGSHPKTVKIMRTKWRNTRAEREGFDPHDDFLDTPLENILQGMEKTSDIDEDGNAKSERPIDCSRKAISFSQVSTQAPNGFYEDANENTEEQNKQITRKLAESNLEIYGSSRERKSDANVQPRGTDDKRKHTSPAVIKAKSLLSKSGPIYKYVEPVRKKDEREKLQGVECNQCRRFYDAVLVNNDSGAARCEHHDAVSRHRYRYIPRSTPEGFWNIGFDSDQ